VLGAQTRRTCPVKTKQKSQVSLGFESSSNVVANKQKKQKETKRNKKKTKDRTSANAEIVPRRF